MTTPEEGEQLNDASRFTLLIDEKFRQTQEAKEAEDYKPRRHAPSQGLREEEIFLATEGAEFFIDHPPESIRAVRPKEGDTTKLKREPLGHQLLILQRPSPKKTITTHIYIKDGELYQDKQTTVENPNPTRTPLRDLETGIMQFLVSGISAAESTSQRTLGPEEATLILQLLQAAVPIPPPPAYRR